MTIRPKTLAALLAIIPLAAMASGLEIPQVSEQPLPRAKSKPVPLPRDEGKDKKSACKTDYQANVLSNPISELGRAQAITGGSGNTAVIMQQGNDNSSTIIQDGETNAILLDQQGGHNRSFEKQTGKNNYKIKIQNDECKDEEKTDNINK